MPNVIIPMRPNINDDHLFINDTSTAIGRNIFGAEFDFVLFPCVVDEFDIEKLSNSVVVLFVELVDLDVS